MREQHWLTLEEAIRKMTSLPAARLSLHNRGVIKAGMKADVVVFDPNRVIDTATMTNPTAEPIGISHVIVNGRLVLEAQLTLSGDVGGSGGL